MYDKVRIDARGIENRGIIEEMVSKLVLWSAPMNLLFRLSST